MTVKLFKKLPSPELKPVIIVQNILIIYIFNALNDLIFLVMVQMRKLT